MLLFYDQYFLSAWIQLTFLKTQSNSLHKILILTQFITNIIGNVTLMNSKGFISSVAPYNIRVPEKQIGTWYSFLTAGAEAHPLLTTGCVWRSFLRVLATWQCARWCDICWVMWPASHAFQRTTKLFHKSIFWLYCLCHILPCRHFFTEGWRDRLFDVFWKLTNNGQCIGVILVIGAQDKAEVCRCPLEDWVRLPILCKFVKSPGIKSCALCNLQIK